MTDKEIELLNIIRDIAKEDGGSAGSWRIYNRAKISGIIPYQKNTGKELKFLLKRLMAEKKIVPDMVRFQHFIPSPLTDGEIEILKQLKKEVKVTLDSIKYCIWTFYKSFGRFPYPSEIEEQFMKEFGKPDQKDFTRVLRFMVEDGTLLRDEDNRYYYRGMVSIDDGLREFVK